MDTLYCAATRRGADGHPEQPWHAAERLSVEETLRAMTEGPAWASFQEKDLGRLAEGRWADVTALSADPRTTEPGDLRSLEVTMTVVGGSVAYRR